jgi:hypothetical protein
MIPTDFSGGELLLLNAGLSIAEFGVRIAYLSVEDAKKLDEVKMALCRDDLEAASRLSRVFRLTPVTI